MTRQARHILLALIAVLAMQAPAAHAAKPANDDFVNAGTISGAPVTVSGTNVDGSHESGEPTLGWDYGRSHSVWYRWVAPRSGTAIVDTTGSALQTRVGIFTGTTVSALTRRDQGGEWPAGRVRVRAPVVAGATYWIMVDGVDYYSLGSFNLAIDVIDPPANDAFATPWELAGEEASAEVDTRGATRETGEPLAAGPASVWFTWTAPSHGGVEVDTAGSDFDTILGAYTGAGPASALKLVASNDNVAQSTRTSRLRFRTTAGTTYRFLVNGATPAATGLARLKLRLTPPPANDMLAASADLGSAPVAGASGNLLGATAEPGEPAHFSYEPATSSVWYSWTAPHRGSLTIKATAGFQTVLAAYRGDTPVGLQRVADQAQAWNGGPEQIRIRVEAGETYRIAVDARYGGLGEFTLALNLIPSPINDDFVDALPLVGPLVEFVGSTVGATQEPCEPVHDDNYYDPSVWFTWTATASGAVTIDTAGSSFNTVVGVYTGGSLCDLVRQPLTRLTGAHTPAKRLFRAEAGVTYRIAVDGAFAASGTYRLSLRTDDPPLNDLFGAAEPLEGSSDTATGTNAGATGEPGEPSNGGEAATSVWYTWTAPSDGAATIALPTRGEGATHWTRVYEGDSIGSLTRVAEGSGTSPARFAPKAGRTYRIGIDGGVRLTQGAFTLALEHAPPPENDAFADAIELTGLTPSASGTTTGATDEDGEPVHGSTDRRATVWYSWTAPSTGRLQVRANTPYTGAERMLYAGDALGALERVPLDYYGRAAVRRGVTYRIAIVDRLTPAKADFTLSLEHRAGPPNDGFDEAAELSGIADETAGTLDLATRDQAEPVHGRDGGGPSVWYRWTAPSDGVMKISASQHQTTEYGFVPSLAVYTGSSVDALTPVAAAQHQTGVRARRGTTYLIAVSNWKETAAGFRVKLTHDEGPDNDMFADAIELNGHTDAGRGNNIAATLEPGEPSPSYNRSSIWYRWTAPTTGRTTIDVTGPGAATNRSVGVYTGEMVDALVPVSHSSTSNGGRAFRAVAGTTYRIALDGYYWQDVGAFTVGLNHVDSPANDAFAGAERLEGAAPVARTHTAGATAEPGEPHHYGSPVGSVWYRWTAPEDGVLRVEPPGNGHGYAVYTGSGLGSMTRLASGGSVASTVRVQRGTDYAIAVDRLYGDGAPGELRLRHLTRPANDGFASAEPLSGYSATVSGHNYGASREAGEPNHGGFAYGASIWYRWRAPASGRVTLDSTGSEPSPLLGVYTGESVGALGGRGSTWGFKLTFDAVAGEVYSIAQEGAYGVFGMTKLSLRLDAIPGTEAPGAPPAPPPPEDDVGEEAETVDPPGQEPPGQDPPAQDPPPADPPAADPPPGPPAPGPPKEDTPAPYPPRNPSLVQGPAHDPPAVGTPAPPPLRVLAGFPKQRIADVLKRGLTGTASCSLACSIHVAVTVDPRAAKNAKLTGSKLTRAKATARADGSPARLVVRLPKAARTKLKKAKSLPLTVRVVATGGGERAKQTLRLKLKR